jgi:hypothetical protein
MENILKAGVYNKDKTAFKMVNFNINLHRELINSNCVFDKERCCYYLTKGSRSIIDFYLANRTNLTKGQRILSNKIKSLLNNPEIEIFRVGDKLYLTDLNFINGDINYINNQLKKLKLKTKIINNNRIEIEIPTMKTKEEKDTIIFTKNLDVIKNFVKNNVNNILSIEKDNDKSEKIFLSNNIYLVISLNETYAAISAWTNVGRKSKYINKIQITYEKEYNKNEIIDRLNKLVER